VDDPQFEQLAEHICLYPGMYVSPPSFGGVCAYLDGFNAARSGAPLLGLHPWLVVRASTGNNMHWSALTRQELADDPADERLADEERAVRALGRLLAEYFEYRKKNGITKVFHNYARWLLKRSWYTGPLRQKNP
jgi:hypothetical protein